MRTTTLIFALFIATNLCAALTPCDVLGVNRPDTLHVEIVFGCQFKTTALATTGAFTLASTSELPQQATIVSAFGGDDPPNNFARLLLQTARPLTPATDYQLTIGHLVDDLFTIDNKTVPVKGTGGLTFDRLTRKLVFASFAVPITEDIPTVSVVRFNKPLTIAVARATRTSSGTAMQVVLAAPLRSGDKVKITAKTPNGGTASVDDKVAFPAPKDRKDAQVFVAVNTDAGVRQKPNVNLDTALNFRRPWVSGWTQAPGLDVTVATQDQNGTNKASLKENFEYFAFPRGASMPIALDITPTIELDKHLQNRNALLDLSTTVLLSGGPHLDVRPGVGVEVGRNFGLQKKFTALKDYSILRPKVTFFGIYAWDFETLGVQRVAFSIDATGRWLTHAEPYTTLIPPAQQTATSGKSTVTLREGFRYTVTPALTLKLGDFYAITLQYERGRKPVFFEDVNKASLKLSFLF
ncbi:MAG TPA: hypothetical protein VGQ46_05045 [Thermoanaerobaculia bacterium]|jgi:hypothetical protein|nr:hypothetical protein [Thermoanaerobaculia bacterium]